MPLNFGKHILPSTTEEVISSKIRKKFEIGKDFFIGYSL